MATRRGEWGEGGDKTRTLVRFGLYNILNNGNGVIESLLRGVDQYNLDLGVL